MWIMLSLSSAYKSKNVYIKLISYVDIANMDNNHLSESYEAVYTLSFHLMFPSNLHTHTKEVFNIELLFLRVDKKIHKNGQLCDKREFIYTKLKFNLIFINCCVFLV